jgi:hypothetical protein
MGWSSRITDPYPKFFTIPDSDPGSKGLNQKSPDPESGSATLRIGTDWYTPLNDRENHILTEGLPPRKNSTGNYRYLSRLHMVGTGTVPVVTVKRSKFGHGP